MLLSRESFLPTHALSFSQISKLLDATEDASFSFLVSLIYPRSDHRFSLTSLFSSLFSERVLPCLSPVLHLRLHLHLPDLEERTQEPVRPALYRAPAPDLPFTLVSSRSNFAFGRVPRLHLRLHEEVVSLQGDLQWEILARCGQCLVIFL